MRYLAALCLHLCLALQYNVSMEKKDFMQIRVSHLEKQGFVDAARLAGIPLSSWVRDHLRLAAIRELESAGRKNPFIEPVRLERDQT